MEKSFLKLLVGKTVTRTELSTNIVAPLSSENSNIGKMFVSIQLYVEDFLLDIYNPIKITPSENELSDFVGKKVIETNEEENFVELIFDDEFNIQINISDEMFTGPEAICLSGPNNLIVVWN